MSKRKTITLDLPEGFKSITVRDEGVGPMLVIEMSNGRHVLVDALNLSGEHECQVGLWDAYENIDTDGGPIAGIAFNGQGAADTKVNVL